MQFQRDKHSLGTTCFRDVFPGTICRDPTQRKSISTTKTRKTAPLLVKTNTPDREGVWEVFLSQGFDNDGIDTVGFEGFDTVEILMASWRKGTFSN